MKDKTKQQSQYAISVKNVSKQFVIPHDKTSTLKGAFVNFFHRKSFETFYALKDVSFEVKKGEFFGILGRNGSGKSTLLKILAGVYTTDIGDIKINGLVSPFLELGIGFNPELSGRDNIYLNATILGLTEKEIDQKFDSIVAFSELERFIDQKVKNYSSGMQVRLSFSVAIHANREILLMDEVLAVGDANFQAKCLNEFEKYKEMGKTVILVTHDIATVQKYCDRAMLLRDGKIQMIGNPEEVGNEYIQQNMSDEEKRTARKDVVRERKITKEINGNLAEIAINDFFLEMVDKDYEIEKLKREIQSKTQEIEGMKLSKFWKIKTFYEKFKFPILNFFRLIKKAIFILKKEGIFIFFKKSIKFVVKYKANYNNFISSQPNTDNIALEIFNKQQKEFSREEIELQIESFSKKPLISIIMPVYNTPPELLKLAINSLRKQIYQNWELCAVDDFSTNENTKSTLKDYALLDPRIKINFLEKNNGISNASNVSVGMAKGEYLALVDHDDELTKDALFWVIKTINENIDADFIYSDECKIDDTDEKKLFHFQFKPDWSPEMLINNMYTGHLTVYKKSLVDELHGFRSTYDFSQDYDLALRASEKAKNICHVERVLYLWRAVDGSAAKGGKDFARVSNLAALENAMERRGVKTEISGRDWTNRAKIIIKNTEKVSIIIPSDSYNNILKSVSTLNKKTPYKKLEIIIVTNSVVAEKLKSGHLNNSKNLIFSIYDKKYNFSDKCNQGVRDSTGEILVFLNDDVFPINNDWLENLIEFLYYDKKIGGVSPKLLWKNNTIQYAGMTTNVVSFCGTFLNGKDEDYYSANMIRNTSILSGACLAMRKKVFLEIGGFDSINTPAGHSDLDLSFKLREKGYRCVYTPYSTLHHIGNHSWHTAKDKADIFILSKWGKYISNDPYYTKSMRTVFEGYFPEQFGIFSHQKEFKPYTFDALVVIHELTITGAPIVALNMAKVIANGGGYPVIFAYVDGPLREEFEKLNIPVIINTLAQTDELNFKYFAKNFDIVIVNTVVAYPAIHAIQNIVPTIWFIHEAQNIESLFIPHFSTRTPSLLEVLKNTKSLVCVASEYSREAVQKYVSNIILLNYGFDDKFNNQELKINKKIDFSIVGTVEKRKAQDIFIKAILQIPENLRHKAVFNIIGNDKCFTDFTNNLKEKTKHVPEVVWHGLIIDQNKKLNLFNDTSVFVVVSRDEPTSIVVIEGAMLGRPSIISKNVGAKYIVDNDKTGFIVDTGSVEQLSQIMINIIDNPKILIPMGKEIRKKYLETSTIDIFKNNLLKIIKEQLHK